MEFASGTLSSCRRSSPAFSCCPPSVPPFIHPSGVFRGDGRVDGCADGLGVMRSTFDQGLLRSAVLVRSRLEGLLRLLDELLSEDEMTPPFPTREGPRPPLPDAIPPCSATSWYQ